MQADQLIEFMHAQVRAWNAGDKDGFFHAYRATAPAGLSIEYVGRGPAVDGWPVLEGMWARQSANIAIEEVALIVNGNEVAAHNRNLVRGTSIAIETIELYRVDDGRMSVRYFVRQPGAVLAAGQVDAAAIERFMSGQVAAWNEHDKPRLMALYREMAPQRLDIGYAGRSTDRDGWFIIEEMYDKHNEQFRLEVVDTIINGDEVAVHHRNCIVGSEAMIESIETYRFEPGALSVVYHLLPPKAEALDLQQFRGFAA